MPAVNPGGMKKIVFGSTWLRGLGSIPTAACTANTNE